MHPAVPDRRDRQLAQGREVAAVHARRSSSRWDSLPPETEPDAGGESEIPDEVAQITAIATAGQGGVAAPPWSAAHPYIGLYTHASARRSRRAPAITG